MINCNNNYNTFIKTEKKHNEKQRKGAQSCPRAAHMTRVNENYDDLVDPKEVNQVRLEHFQNFKQLRRRMDQSYLKVKQLEAQGIGRASSQNTNRDSANCSLIEKAPGESKSKSSNPQFDENENLFNNIS